MKSKKNSLLSIGRLLSSLSVPFRQIRRGPIKPEWMSFSWKTRQAKCKRLPFIGIFLFSLLTVTVLTQKEISSKRLQTWRSVMKKSGLLSFIWIITWKSTTKRTPFIECPCCIKGFACSILFNPGKSPKWQVEVHSLNACLLTSPPPSFYHSLFWFWERNWFPTPASFWSFQRQVLTKLFSPSLNTLRDNPQLPKLLDYGASPPHTLPILFLNFRTWG